MSHGCHLRGEPHDHAHFAKYRGKLHRQGLETATVISQVDQKFILAKLHPASGEDVNGGVLVLIDQHAADERCRIERLFYEMFVSAEDLHQGTRVAAVDIDPIVFNVSITEAALFSKYSSFLRKWGFSYDQATHTESDMTITVNSLPALIAERCRLEPSLVIDILRRDIWTREENGERVQMSKLGPDNDSQPYDQASLNGHDPSIMNSMLASTPIPHPWIQKMNGCPQGVLDLLNSRACRGAIMFNDPLSITECELLIGRLARCAFPFQCAHGRPSMIPVLDLRPQLEHEASMITTDGGVFGDEHESGLNFVQAFRAHYRK
ncbi:DNA mismatch repair protein (Mlh3) [Penicillium chermesinum]|nr:DNA mismatch repair protein (Mlh3) [Penicillium chermesinum]